MKRCDIALRVGLLLGLATLSMGSVAFGQSATVANPLAPSLVQKVILSGRVTSTSNAPVARAEVRIISKDGTVLVNALTSADGTYEFAVPTSGETSWPFQAGSTYVVEAQSRSTVARRSVVIAGTMVTRADISLGPIARIGGAILAPKTTVIVTDRDAGASPGPSPTPIPLALAFANDRPIEPIVPLDERCVPTCALHFGVVATNGPVLTGVQTEADLDALAATFKTLYPTATSLTIFVHGYNSDFPGPVRLTASAIAKVAPQTIPVAFSWPSKDKTIDYIDDESSNGWASPHFRDLLLALMVRTDVPTTVNIVAHSMGNRIVVDALQYLAHAKPALHARVGQVVFAAPDVDATTFWEAVPYMAEISDGLTIYGSTHDEALQSSRLLHGHCRAGLVGCLPGESTTALPSNVNAIDASFFHCDLIGHGYWSASATMLDDITAIMQSGTMPPNGPPRNNLAIRSPGRYAFVKAVVDDCAAQPQ